MFDGLEIPFRSGVAAEFEPSFSTLLLTVFVEFTIFLFVTLLLLLLAVLFLVTGELHSIDIVDKAVAALTTLESLFWRAGEIGVLSFSILFDVVTDVELEDGIVTDGGSSRTVSLLLLDLVSSGTFLEGEPFVWTTISDEWRLGVLSGTPFVDEPDLKLLQVDDLEGTDGGIISSDEPFVISCGCAGNLGRSHWVVFVTWFTK